MLPPVSVIFIGTPEFAVPSLHRLAANFEIAAVITQPDRPSGRGRRLASSPVKREAERLGLNVMQPQSLRDEQVIEDIRALHPSVMVAVAYGQILRPEFLGIAPAGVLNVHPSLLPRWRGASPVAGAILAGDEETGVTVMLMDPGMDTGPVLAQRPYPISPDDTTGSLNEALARKGAELLVATLPGWLDGEIEPRPQDNSLATVTKLVRKEDGAIEWSLPAVEIWRRVRAYNPWPGAYTFLNGNMVRIWRALPLAEVAAASPGTIVGVSDSSRTETRDAAFAVSTGEGMLAVLEAQKAGRKRLSSAEFARGMPGLVGSRLGSANGPH
jgi:methionyl-tRNA formyltransferase